MGFTKGLTNGVGISLAYFIIFGSYALAFWYGIGLISDGVITAGNLLTVSAFARVPNNNSVHMLLSLLRCSLPL